MQACSALVFSRDWLSAQGILQCSLAGTCIPATAMALPCEGMLALVNMHCMSWWTTCKADLEAALTRASTAAGSG